MKIKPVPYDSYTLEQIVTGHDDTGFQTTLKSVQTKTELTAAP